jgi:hypothetical protein
VVRIVLRRALRRAFPVQAAGGDIDAWLLRDGLLLNAELPPQAAGPEAVLTLVAALAEQMWCLLGAQASAPIRAALARVFPGGPEPLSRQ